MRYSWFIKSLWQYHTQSVLLHIQPYPIYYNFWGVLVMGITTDCRGMQSNAPEDLGMRGFGQRTRTVRAVPSSKGQYSMQRLADKHACYTAHGQEAYQGFHSSSLESVHHWTADRPPVLFVCLRHTAQYTERRTRKITVISCEQQKLNFLSLGDKFLGQVNLTALGQGSLQKLEPSQIINSDNM